MSIRRLTKEFLIKNKIQIVLIFVAVFTVLGISLSYSYLVDAPIVTYYGNSGATIYSADGSTLQIYKTTSEITSSSNNNYAKLSQTATFNLTVENSYSTNYDLYYQVNINGYSEENEDNLLLLEITNPEGQVLTALSGYNYVTVDGVSGFDITNALGSILISEDYEISATSETIQEWKFNVYMSGYTGDVSVSSSAFSGEPNISEVEMYESGSGSSGSYENGVVCYTTSSSNECLDKEAYKEYLENLYNAILNQDGGAETIEAKGTPNYSSHSTIDDGLYAIVDEYGTSYYYRGAVDDNWAYFAGFYWRIIRIDGEGNIKMIYSGSTAPTSADAVTMTGTGTQLSSKSAFNSTATYYVGYVYSSSSLHGTTSTSTAKSAIDTWYTTYIENKGYDSYLATTMYCIDRTAYSNTTGTSSVTTVTTSATYYNAYVRLWSNTSPSLMCTNSSDEISLKVGLISADEVVLAGAGAGSANYYVTNSSYYLYTGQYYWTLSPYRFNGSYAYVFIVESNGYLDGNIVASTYGLRPVVSLTSDTQIIKGSGTYSDPYVITE